MNESKQPTTMLHGADDLLWELQDRIKKLKRKLRKKKKWIEACEEVLSREAGPFWVYEVRAAYGGKKEKGIGPPLCDAAPDDAWNMKEEMRLSVIALAMSGHKLYKQEMDDAKARRAEAWRMRCERRKAKGVREPLSEYYTWDKEILKIYNEVYSQPNPTDHV